MKQSEYAVVVDAQRAALLATGEGAVCTDRYTTEISAARKADDINNGRSAHWSPSYFQATFTRRKDPVDGRYEVLVMLRPGVSLSYVRDIYDVPDGARSDIDIATKTDLVDRMVIFRRDLGDDSVASLAANMLHRSLRVTSVGELARLRSTLGDEEFSRRVRKSRNVGPAVLARVLERTRS